MPAYEGELFAPPAPVARISLRNPKSGKIVQDVAMLIDSGADVTLVPGSVLAELDIEQVTASSTNCSGSMVVPRWFRSRILTCCSVAQPSEDSS
jgi:hypothetical protein